MVINFTTGSNQLFLGHNLSTTNASQ